MSKDDLIAAKALIDAPENWVKGSWSRGGMGMCALGAAMRATECGILAITSQKNPMTRALANALPKPGYAHWQIAKFNDDPATSHADIMALFDRAIEAAS